MIQVHCCSQMPSETGPNIFTISQVETEANRTPTLMVFSTQKDDPALH